MALMTNAGQNPLIFPDKPLIVVPVGGDVQVSKETAEIPGVAEWIKNGNLVPAKKSGKGD